MTAFNATNPYLDKSWNPATRQFETASASWSFPMAAFSYEEVGRIVEVAPGVTKVGEGDLIWGAWGHRSQHVASADWASVRVLRPGVDPVNGIFAQIGGIALNAVLDADIHVGEYVAIFGQGVPGQMAAQLAKANGGTVIAVDRLDSRLAQSVAADFTVNSAAVDAATRIKDITGGRGADVSIEISGAYPALHDAIRSTAYNSKVVVSGFFQGDGAGLRLGEEFHHNRIELVCSQIGGVNRGLDHRWDRLRLDQTVMQLIAAGRVDFARLITHRFPAAQAQQAFDLLRDAPGEALQIVLTFGES
jgi:threonine dehydrogenase-like Zn-dependent dehydrogenase